MAVDIEQIKHEAKEEEYNKGYDPEDIVLIYCKLCDDEFSVIAGEAECPLCGGASEVCL